MAKLYDYLLEKMGGQEAAVVAFLKNKLHSLDVLGMTASELFAIAEKEGWDSWLRNLTLDEFHELLGGADTDELHTPEPPATAPTLERRIRRRKPKKQTPDPPPQPEKKPDEKEVIIAFLRTHPWIRRSTVADGTGLLMERVSALLDSLINDNLVKVVGEGEAARLALA
ncbi:MAG: hypothetical protein QNJ97_23395 [Myxococcota bacterium]|nr:hypothetical protein [Myxococcota bacterium]